MTCESTVPSFLRDIHSPFFGPESVDLLPPSNTLSFVVGVQKWMVVKKKMEPITANTIFRSCITTNMMLIPVLTGVDLVVNEKPHKKVWLLHEVDKVHITLIQMDGSVSFR